MFKILLQKVHWGWGWPVKKNLEALCTFCKIWVNICFQVADGNQELFELRTPVYNKSDHWPLYQRSEPQYYIWNGNIKGEKCNMHGTAFNISQDETSKLNAQALVRVLEQHHVLFGMSLCPCWERKIGQVNFHDGQYLLLNFFFVF